MLRYMKQAKMPADPNRRAKATVDMIDAILDRWPEPVAQEKDPERVARGKLGGAKGQARDRHAAHDFLSICGAHVDIC
jgi:hypothetical protein